MPLLVTLPVVVICIQVLVVEADQTQPVSVFTPKLPEEFVCPCEAPLADNVKLHGAPD